ncbi:MAG: aminotransferase class I/II-fold pyridoxal phosphate-dependent enzyme, partial [Bifidobacterium criceti]|nr:aminotransferase class I/II-fold pyridoxal phosphate-dependent enzyme [Bifidobacterium criceti]
IDCLRIVRMPYHLSAVTQAAALAGFDHTDEQLSQVDYLRRTREETAAWLKEQTYDGTPLEVAPSQSNFLMFGGHFDDRGAIFDEMLTRGVLIRVVGPEGWLRVCMGTDEEMKAFRDALTASMRAVEQRRTA